MHPIKIIIIKIKKNHKLSYNKVTNTQTEKTVKFPHLFNHNHIKTTTIESSQKDPYDHLLNIIIVMTIYIIKIGLLLFH